MVVKKQKTPSGVITSESNLELMKCSSLTRRKRAPQNCKILWATRIQVNLSSASATDIFSFPFFMKEGVDGEKPDGVIVIMVTALTLRHSAQLPPPAFAFAHFGYSFFHKEGE